MSAAQVAAAAAVVLIGVVAVFQLAVMQAIVLVLNTLTNFSPHPTERWVMGSVTLVLSALTLLIALTA